MAGPLDAVIGFLANIGGMIPGMADKDEKTKAMVGGVLVLVFVVLVYAFITGKIKLPFLGGKSKEENKGEGQ